MNGLIILILLIFQCNVLLAYKEPLFSQIKANVSNDTLFVELTYKNIGTTDLYLMIGQWAIEGVLEGNHNPMQGFPLVSLLFNYVFFRQYDIDSPKNYHDTKDSVTDEFGEMVYGPYQKYFPNVIKLKPNEKKSFEVIYFGNKNLNKLGNLTHYITFRISYVKKNTWNELVSKFGKIIKSAVFNNKNDYVAWIRDIKLKWDNWISLTKITNHSNILVPQEKEDLIRESFYLKKWSTGPITRK